MRTCTVKLDDPKYPGNGGVVIAVDQTVEQYLAAYRGPDGAMPHGYRLWAWSPGAELDVRVRLPQ